MAYGQNTLPTGGKSQLHLKILLNSKFRKALEQSLQSAKEERMFLRVSFMYESIKGHSENGISQELWC